MVKTADDQSATRQKSREEHHCRVPGVSSLLSEAWPRKLCRASGSTEVPHRLRKSLSLSYLASQVFRGPFRASQASRVR